MSGIEKWHICTPVMVMPDGTERSFDTFTKEELREWGKRAQRRAMLAAGYRVVEDDQSDQTRTAEAV